jgi:PAS domain S-box-containing protein
MLSHTDLERLGALIAREGIRALSAIPLVYQGRILGRLMAYFDTPHTFTEEEIQLAQTIAAHVAFAIGRQRASDALQAIVDGASQSTGAEFFRILVRHLASALHLRWAFVGESAGAGRDRIRTLALWAGSDYAPNFEYDLAGTPCEGVMGRAMCCYPRDVARTFPQDHLLVELGVESYIGVRLSDSSGNSLGILVVMNDTPIHEPSQVQSILSVFAARAGAELERLQTEQRLEREQQLYRSLAERIGEAFFLCDTDTGRIIEANPVLQTLLGYTRDELLSMTLYEIRYDDPAAVERYIQDHIRGPHHTLRRMRYRHKDGTPVDVETSTNLFVSDQQRELFVLVRFADREAVRLVSNAAQGRDCSPVGAMFDSDGD